MIVGCSSLTVAPVASQFQSPIEIGSLNIKLCGEIQVGEVLRLVGDFEKLPYAYFGNKELLRQPWKALEDNPFLLSCYKTLDLKIYSAYDPTIIMPGYLNTQTQEGTFREYYLGSFLSDLCGQWGLDLLCFLSEFECSESLFLLDHHQDIEGRLMGLSQEGINLEYQLDVHQLLVKGMI